ncbi:MAG: ectoine hydroxylase-related dioxygenase (phytanoyl-CoA dioxygenase family) [Gammaproteobacteria bacterium]|jgi:ectoine hydroxylase-related dioxygenase (phytanoyl-CoA dioxygenase family)
MLAFPRTHPALDDAYDEMAESATVPLGEIYRALVGWTHWENEALDAHTHGFNFMAQLYGCNAANGLWVVPGSNRQSKADIKAMVTAAGSERLPEAVPVICAPGDVCINSRQAIHGSFANTSPDVRVTINFGFHRRDSVLGVKSGGVHNPISEYNEDYIKQRSRLIGYAIDARQQQYPGEIPYTYRPFAQSMDEYVWHPEGLSDLKDYNLQDIGI